MDLYRNYVRPLLFRLDAETAHKATVHATAVAGVVSRRLLSRLGGNCPPDPRLAMDVAGLKFANPVGLAPGFDKSGRAVHGLARMGFGSVEVGSVSAQASRGNAKPRLFRLPADQAIVVNYGVPNDGAVVVARRLAAARTVAGGLPVPVGVNLVETNTSRPTNPDGVVDELLAAARPFCGLADYLTVNLNCPNTTAGVSPFDAPTRLRHLLQAMSVLPDLPPVFLKFTAHRDPARADTLLEAVAGHRFIAGLIFNLPPGTAYDLHTPRTQVDAMPGTLCGLPTRDMMDDTLRFWYPRIDTSRQVIIGSGGISSAEDAYRKIRLGASLVQLYTAVIYQGPALVGRKRHGLAELLERDGLSHLSEAVGLDHVDGHI